MILVTAGNLVLALVVRRRPARQAWPAGPPAVGHGAGRGVQRGRGHREDYCESLRRSRHPALEAVVVDDGSTDGTVGRRSGSPRPGTGAAGDRGASTAARPRRSTWAWPSGPGGGRADVRRGQRASCRARLRKLGAALRRPAHWRGRGRWSRSATGTGLLTSVAVAWSTSDRASTIERTAQSLLACDHDRPRRLRRLAAGQRCWRSAVRLDRHTRRGLRPHPVAAAGRLADRA